MLIRHLEMRCLLHCSVVCSLVLRQILSPSLWGFVRIPFIPCFRLNMGLLVHVKRHLFLPPNDNYRPVDNDGEKCIMQVKPRQGRSLARITVLLKGFTGRLFYAMLHCRKSYIGKAILELYLV